MPHPDTHNGYNGHNDPGKIIDFTSAAATLAQREGKIFVDNSMTLVVNGIIAEVMDARHSVSPHEVRRVDSYTRVVTDRHLPGLTIPDNTDSYTPIWRDIQGALQSHLKELARSKPAFQNTVATRTGVLIRLGFRGPETQIGLTFIPAAADGNLYYVESPITKPDVHLVGRAKQVTDGVVVSERMLISKSLHDIRDIIRSNPDQLFPSTQ